MRIYAVHLFDGRYKYYISYSSHILGYKVTNLNCATFFTRKEDADECIRKCVLYDSKYTYTTNIYTVHSLYLEGEISNRIDEQRRLDPDL